MDIFWSGLSAISGVLYIYVLASVCRGVRLLQRPLREDLEASCSLGSFSGVKLEVEERKQDQASEKFSFSNKDQGHECLVPLRGVPMEPWVGTLTSVPMDVAATRRHNLGQGCSWSESSRVSPPVCSSAFFAHGVGQVTTPITKLPLFFPLRLVFTLFSFKNHSTFSFPSSLLPPQEEE